MPVTPLPHGPPPATTTQADKMKYSSSNTSTSIYQYGKIKPGVYKIKNVVSGTFVDIKDDARELCGRPSSSLEASRGQVSLHVRLGTDVPNRKKWEILPLGAGYTIRKVSINLSLGHPLLR